jgi:hypothetical protein
LHALARVAWVEGTAQAAVLHRCARHDGRREVTPVREDSEAIIRIYEEQQAA